MAPPPSWLKLRHMKGSRNFSIIITKWRATTVERQRLRQRQAWEALQLAPARAVDHGGPEFLQRLHQRGEHLEEDVIGRVVAQRGRMLPPEMRWLFRRMA